MYGNGNCHHHDGRQRQSDGRGYYSNRGRGRGGGTSHGGDRGLHDEQRRPLDSKNSYRGRGRGSGRHCDPSNDSGSNKKGGLGQSTIASRPTECMVATNNYPLKIMDPEKNQADFASYKVKIYNAKYKVKQDYETGQLVKDSNGRVVKEFTPEHTSICVETFFKSPQPVRILKKLVADEYQKNPDFLLIDGVTKYQVCIKRDCEVDDPDADKVPNKWFLVELEKTHTILFSDLAAAINERSLPKNTVQELSNMMTTILKWFDKDKIPIISERRGNYFLIAGVRIDDLPNLRNNTSLQKEVEAALNEMTLDFEYTMKNPTDRMLKQGKTTDEIKDYRRRVVKSQGLKSDAKEVDEKGDCIKWSPYDHSFEKGEMITTVSEHFRDAYDIELNPNLPIVFLGKIIGWLPLEFTYQTLAKTRDANGPEMIEAVLRYYDRIAGTQFTKDMNHKRELVSKMSTLQEEEYTFA
eukprot:scaffold16413_cov52-Cyclotella_meneghiniana.AAC.3